MGDFDGRRAVVVGGGSGIGAAICRLLVAAGAAVAVLDRDGDAAGRVAAEVGGHPFTVDVRSSAAVDAAVRGSADALHGLDVVVNSAGTGMAKPLTTYTDKEWRRLIDVNLSGTFYVMRATIPLLLASGGGSIVNVASLTGTRPTRGEGPYSAAKAGVINLTQTAALECAPTIRVNSVSPGLIDTPLTELVTATPEFRAAAEAGTPLRRVGAAEEVAEVVVFLASRRAAYVTGQDLVVDGGSVLPSLQSDALLRAISDRFGEGLASEGDRPKRA